MKTYRQFVTVWTHHGAPFACTFRLVSEVGGVRLEQYLPGTDTWEPASVEDLGPKDSCPETLMKPGGQFLPLTMSAWRAFLVGAGVWE